jgi:D-lactate dehydrogenase (cytochrome)
VPISRLAECLLDTQRDIQETGMVAPIVGHVGDGNFHTVILVNPNDETQITEAKDLNNRIVEVALDLDGTCTGEHGVGRGKMDFLVKEHGGAVDMMKAVKVALDPDNIMKPGKIVRL